ncbi:enoyl-[acyl-carrier-protein] reductase FabI [Legionella taurinensis]|uniref:Enoyl-[acyl-carrier-protein] reductase [NADH] n=1 Tax=Legionella taurinensis TaxID=70611 RepID=A0AB38N1Z6_9GAMM|nr:enoyl-ACP reductase FabI [Legionella taurinensis]MDX1838374.1 enoyl-ACP reductase FabI [Legionella taurinensis]PUT39135.1 enoyl-[acyl-carrier-protein] reductase FabI [Legionella taurinensis]PUT39760.1 enoyl-[acyl-carrier-protein] reductase FabI [Legionella taurinensis]PUT43591.1 enoyl-[acyl-carrier-protein] reductase FabI [Legionella taurinensis]PUT45247.1 enoyl-[acyl-carrier-protein] reductase FabI [Legionella taurinensis]
MTHLKGLIVGIANNDSIAWGCAKVLHEAGCELAITYQNEKTRAYIEPLVNEIACPIVMPLDVREADQMDALFERIQTHWGRLDFLIHAIAFAPKSDLQGRVVDCSREGFMVAMDISCHSFIRLANAAEPLMSHGGSLITMSYYGSEKVVQNYNVMGPVKAALEATVRYLAIELGSKKIRVNAISPGPVSTRAASGLTDFDELMEKAAQKAPLHQRVTIEAIGEMAAFLVSEKAQAITGQILYVDGGYNIQD